MKINDFVNVTRNKANNQLSFNLKAKKLKEAGMTPQKILDIKINKSFIKNDCNIAKKEDRLKWKIKKNK